LPQIFNKPISINIIISISLICINPIRPTQNNKKLTQSHVFAKYTNNQSRNYHVAFLKSFKGPAVWWLGASTPQIEDFLEMRFFPRESLIISKNNIL